MISEHIAIAKISANISEFHRQILDDWCKAYLAELYESGIKDLKPSMFVLCEREFHEEHGKLIKTYYVRKKTEQEELVEQEKLTQWKKLDEEKTEIGQHVLIYLKYSRDSSSFKEVIYTDENNLSLMFHSVDFEYGFPEIKMWMHLPDKPK